MTYPGATTFPGAGVFPGSVSAPTGTPGAVAPAGPGTSGFTVFAYDINTNTKICELPAIGLKFDSRLNDAGALSFDIDLLDPRAVATVAPFLSYYANKVPVAFYVDLNGTLVWGGYQTTGNYASTRHALQVTGKEWLGFFAQRLIGAPYDQKTYPNGIDPARLLYLAITDAQDPTKCGPGANLGISVVGGSSAVPFVKPSYQLTQTYVSQVIADCTAGVTPGTGGVDIYADVAWGPSGAPTVTFQIESPRAGRAAGTTGLTFDLLGALDFTWPSDYMQACTILREVGGGSGQIVPSEVVPTTLAVGGLGQMPRMDKVIQHSNVLSREWLAALARGEAQTYGGPLVTPTVTLPVADPTTPLGTWIQGDDARLYAPPFELFPAGIDQSWRIVQHQVQVPDAGVPTVTLTFNPPPQF